MNRIKQFDYIRVISIFCILICHSCICFASTDWLGRYFALTFNFLFLTLSAFLFGMSWHSNGQKSYDKGFIFKRFSKISKTYYPYLAILFLFLYFTEDYFSWKNMISHILYLPWFDKIEGYGHLWFMTMIAICYMGIYMVSKMQIAKKNNPLATVILIAVSILLDCLVSRFGLPGYMFPYAVGYILIFMYSNFILEGIKKIGTGLVIAQFLIINTLAIIAFKYGAFSSYRIAAYFIGIVCSCSVFIFMFRIFEWLPQSKIILWLSGISFEIYLVHEFFLNRYNVYYMIDAPIISYLLLAIFSIASAFVLSQISKFITIRKFH